MDKIEALKKAEQYSVLVKKHLTPVKMYLFGSYAKNNPREDSDIDVAIVVDDIDGDYFLITPLLWKLRRQIDERIEPLLIERNHDDAGFLNEIQKYGIEIL